ncbi:MULTISPECIES: glycosyltransferase [Niastella]|uniref:Glycosyltransferase n=1 Tax=Niastella soli TaxID=2821487 RepID=A0ABS3YMA9_9BACT|nr:glycosyltransferase [Niastella soli]MBO9199020.1 glycosyltransferase [Niastella soli]
MDPAKGISIVTPFFNQSEVFWETYNAVINQTYSNWEWVIVNDGSVNTTSLEILEKVSSLNKKIRIASLPNNMGLPAARNKGVQEAFFDFIFFLDSDDLIEPDYLEKAWLTLQLNPEFTFVNSWSTGFGAKNYNWQAGLDKKEAFLQQNWVAFAGLFRKKLFTHLQFNEARRNGLEDWEFWLQAANSGYWGYTIPEYLFHYRIHDNQHNKWENWDNGRMQKKIKSDLQTKYASLKKQFPNPQKRIYTEVPAMDVLMNSIAPEHNKKTVLIVLPWLELGGVERFTLNYMATLASVFDFILITTNAGTHSHEAEFKKYSRQIYHFAALADGTAYPILWNYVIKTWQINLLVISHSLPAYYILPWLKASHAQLAIIDIMHLVEENWKAGGYPKIAVDYTAAIDKHVVASNQIHRFMTSRGVPTDKLETIYINVDTKNIRPVEETVRPARKKAFFKLQSADQLVLLFSGRLTEQKNALLLPDIAATLAKKGVQFILAIAGDGPEKDLLEEKIYQKRLQHHFRFLGSLSYTANIEAIQMADILVLPSAWEGIATVLYEAMAVSTPVVATAVGGQQELIEPGTGIILPFTGNNIQFIETFAANVESLANDAALRKRMAEAARKRVAEHFDISLTHNSLQLSFEKLLTPRAPLTTTLSQAESIENYYQNISSWKQEQSLPSGPDWKQRRVIKIIKRFYKVFTRKRPLQYLWTRGKKSIG